METNEPKNPEKIEKEKKPGFLYCDSKNIKVLYISIIAITVLGLIGLTQWGGTRVMAYTIGTIFGMAVPAFVIGFLIWALVLKGRKNLGVLCFAVLYLMQGGYYGWDIYKK